jgi:hypothetical protein
VFRRNVKAFPWKRQGSQAATLINALSGTGFVGQRRQSGADARVIRANSPKRRKAVLNIILLLDRSVFLVQARCLGYQRGNELGWALARTLRSFPQGFLDSR